MTARSNGKQAIVLIHGIGEQKPMETLRGFVDSVWTHDPGVQRKHGSDRSASWSKPDRVSESFELRRITTPDNAAGRRTDFFEFYWAHLMHGTTLQHVTAWARFLLRHDPRGLTPELQAIYGTIVLGGLVAGLFLLNGATGTIDIPGWLSATLSVAVLPGLGFVLKQFVGDAARYLHPSPVNVGRRQEIREVGVETIAKLHERGYDRIVVVGHSLGSVIGYDVLTHAWARFHKTQDASPALKDDALERIEKLAAEAADSKGLPTTAADAREVQNAQRDYFDELRANGGQWRVTDFVTLGSPLTHAEVLMARDGADLERKKLQRELPTCLPALEAETRDKQTRLRFTFAYPTKRSKSRVPHHAALFAVTRWTNLYFPTRGLLGGDLIAGPLRDVFGGGVLDVPVETRQRSGRLSHTLYWTPPKGQPDASHIAALRRAVNLLDRRHSGEEGGSIRSDPTATAE